jgi:hypothetical protein
VRCNRVPQLPSTLKNVKSWKKCEQRRIEWAMYESRGMSCVMWKDKCPVLLLSTHAIPIGYPYMPRDEVPHRNGAIWEQVPTSPVLQEYTKFMSGLDVADQL